MTLHTTFLRFLTCGSLRWEKIVVTIIHDFVSNINYRCFLHHAIAIYDELFILITVLKSLKLIKIHWLIVFLVYL